jgi:hypothetical protein
MCAGRVKDWCAQFRMILISDWQTRVPILDYLNQSAAAHACVTCIICVACGSSPGATFDATSKTDADEQPQTGSTKSEIRSRVCQSEIKIIRNWAHQSYFLTTRSQVGTGWHDYLARAEKATELLTAVCTDCSLTSYPHTWTYLMCNCAIVQQTSSYGPPLRMYKSSVEGLRTRFTQRLLARARRIAESTILTERGRVVRLL